MKKHKINSLLFLAFSSCLMVMFALSCKKMPLTNGDAVKETRTLTSFNKVHINDNIDVNLIRSDSCYIDIIAGENLISNIVSEVVDGILMIRNDNIGNIFRDNETPLRADVYFDTNIREIYYHSIGDLHSSDYINDDSLSVFDFDIEDGSGDINLKLICETLNLDYHEGTSLVNIEGWCDEINIYRKGLGPIHLEDIQARSADITLYRGNDIYVNCRDYIYCKIYDFGNIYYRGHPKIDSYITPDATGRVIALDW